MFDKDPIQNEPLLTATELAKKLGRPRGTIYAWASRGLIPSIEIPGTGRLYYESQVRAHIARHITMPKIEQ